MFIKYSMLLVIFLYFCTCYAQAADITPLNLPDKSPTADNIPLTFVNTVKGLDVLVLIFKGEEKIPLARIDLHSNEDAVLLLEKDEYDIYIATRHNYDIYYNMRIFVDLNDKYDYTVEIYEENGVVGARVLEDNLIPIHRPS